MGTQDRKQREKSFKTQLIIDTAEEIVFKEKKSDFSMNEVAQRAELSVGSLYSYFKNKDEIIAAICIRGIDTLLKMEKNGFPQNLKGSEQLAKCFEIYLKFAKKYYQYFSLIEEFFRNKSHQPELKGSPIVQELEEKNRSSLDYLKQSIENGIKDGSIKNQESPQNTVILLGITMESFIAKMLHKGYQERLKSVYDIKHQDLLELYLKTIHCSILEI